MTHTMNQQMYHQSNWLKFTLCITIIWTLTSCDSGSGGEQKSPEVTQRLQYQGLETSAVLTTDNVGEVLVRVLSVGTFSPEGLSGVTSNSPGAKPSSMRRSEKSALPSGPGLSHAKIDINETTICDGGGSFSLKGELNEMGIGKLHVDYDKCIIDGSQLHGTGLFNIRSFDFVQEEPDRYVFEAEHMELISSAGRLKFSGTMDYTILPDKEVVLNNLVLLDELNDLGYKFRNLEVTSGPPMHASNGVVEVEEIRGRLYFSDLGFLDVDTLAEIHYLSESESLPVSGQIKISGGSNRFFIMDFLDKSISSNLSNTETTHINYLTNAELNDLTLIDLSDADNDGMHLSFEDIMGLDPTIDDAALNDDGDLFTNSEEYIKGSDPKSASSPRAPETDIGLDLRLSKIPFSESESVYLPESGTAIALTYGDSIAISLMLDFLKAAQTFEKFHGFEKMSIRLSIPPGFEFTEFSTGDVECVHVGDILCNFPPNFNLDRDFKLLFEAQLKVNSDADQGIGLFKVQVEGFLELSESSLLPSTSVLVGWPLSAFQEIFSRRPAQNEIKEVALDQEVYWGRPTLTFSTKLIGSSDNRKTKVYLSGDLYVSHHLVEISNIEFFGRKDIIIHNFASNPKDATVIKNNTFNNTKLTCSGGNASIIGNLFESDRGQISSVESCDNLSVLNNVLISQGNIFNLEGVFPQLELVNNTIKGGGLGVFSHINSAIQMNFFITNNLFLGGSSYPAEQSDILHHIYMLDDYRNRAVVTNNFFEHTDLYVDSLKLSTQMGESNFHSNDPRISPEAQLFKILPDSLLIDKGVASEKVGLIDYFGNPRNSDGDGDGESIPDIGAHEYILH